MENFGLKIYNFLRERELDYYYKLFGGYQGITYLCIKQKYIMAVRRSIRIDNDIDSRIVRYSDRINLSFNKTVELLLENGLKFASSPKSQVESEVIAQIKENLFTNRDVIRPSAREEAKFDMAEAIDFAQKRKRKLGGKY
jgi:hypothetical protein